MLTLIHTTMPVPTGYDASGRARAQAAIAATDTDTGTGLRRPSSPPKEGTG